MMPGIPLLSLAIWIPIVAGVVVLAIGSDRHAGAARLVGWTASVVRLFQSGLIYQYAFTMIIGVFVLLTLWFARA